MILVDIYIPAVDETYDFMLEENVETDKIIDEITEMITKKMKGGSTEHTSEFLLYSMATERMLERRKSLQQNGVQDGTKLMLV